MRCWGLLATYVAFYPSVQRDSSYSDLMNRMPDSLRSLFTGGTATDLASPEGYLYTEMLSFMAPLSSSSTRSRPGPPG